MRITAHFAASAGKSPVTLGDDTSRELVSDFTPSHNCSSEEIPLPRAEWLVTIIDRGNRSNQVTFQTDRDHGSENDANFFLLSHADQVSGNADVEFEETDSSGASITRWLRAAFIGTVTCSANKGSSTTMSYTIKGGQFFASQK